MSRRANYEDRLNAELQFDFDQRVAAKIAQGLSDSEARRAVRLEFGGTEQIREECREVRPLRRFHSILQDLKYAARTMRRSPAFFAVAIAMLAVGIGLNTAMFTIANAVLFKGFPGVNANSRIVYITSGTGCCVSWPDFQDWRARVRSFTGMALVHGTATVFGDSTSWPERRDVTEVTAGTFALAGVKPVLGRDFEPADELPGARRVVILRYSFWQRRYGMNRAILGRTVRLNGQPATVIAIMPEGFSFPQNQDLWIPLQSTPEVRKRENRATWFVFARLADRVSIDAARSEMAAVGRQLGLEYPRTNRGRNLIPHVESFESFFIGANASLTYKAMWGAVGFVLLIACANLANLLLTRAAGRSREISARIALGAGRWRILRQLLAESLLLSGIGGVLGWGFAALAVRLYRIAATGSALSDAIAGSWFDNVVDYSMDYRAFAWLAAISLITGIAFGLGPARRLWSVDVVAGLKSGGRAAIGSVGQGRLSTALIAAQMSLALILLGGTGVMIRSFMKIYSADLGFNPDNTQAAFLSLPSSRYQTAESRLRFFNELEARLHSLPGVESVSVTDALPAGAGPRHLEFETEDSPRMDRPVAGTVVVGSQWFNTLGKPALAGREFNDRDNSAGASVVVVNSAFADRYWPGVNPLGHRLRTYSASAPDVWRTVVGVAPNIVQDSRTRQEFSPLIYVPHAQTDAGGMWIVVGSRLPIATLSPAFRAEMARIDPELPAAVELSPLKAKLSDAYRYCALTGTLLLIFAALALLIAAIGLYAVIAGAAARRTQEIGVRMAIGATARDIRAMLSRRALAPMGIGLALGLAGSLALNRLLSSALAGVSPGDPAALAVASATLIATGALAAWIPSTRAARVNPTTALRQE